jgi:cytochrome c oxidase cbb3-type subunit III
VNATCLARTMAIVIAAMAAASCEREHRELIVPADAAERIHSVRLTNLVAGAPTPETPPPNEYEENAYALNEGKRLFGWYNCSGCHANGGGGMGPPLMDDRWIYGGEPAQIFKTIVEGRPSGMPSFRGKIPDHEVWKLAAYVRSLSGNVAKDAAPGRRDDIAVAPAEQQVPDQPPVQSETQP